MYFLFLLFLSIQPGFYNGKYNKSCTPFKRFKFEQSLYKYLFYNIHRMDKHSFYNIRDDMLPYLRKKYKRNKNVRLLYESMISLNLSYLGGARIYYLRVLHRPKKKKVIFLYVWNVIDVINETYAFLFPIRS